MDFNDPRQRAVFFDVHRGLPREGPGNRASLERALAMAGVVRGPLSILDIGCGPGQQTLDLADAFPEARIAAVDTHPDFIADLAARAAAAGCGERVDARVGDMAALDSQTPPSTSSGVRARPTSWASVKPSTPGKACSSPRGALTDAVTFSTS